MEIQAGTEKDYEQAEEMMKQVQNLHIGLRPDIYKEADVILSLEEYREAMEAEKVFLAKEGEKVCGLLLLSERCMKGKTVAKRHVLFIDALVVDEKSRRQGIGTQLLDFAKELAKGYDGLELQVNARNEAARRLYERYGFREKSVNMELV